MNYTISANGKSLRLPFIVTAVVTSLGPLQGATATTTTDVPTGRFLLSVPPSTYSVTFLYGGFLYFLNARLNMYRPLSILSSFIVTDSHQQTQGL